MARKRNSNPFSGPYLDFLPQRTMRPNERCWCGSGRKWKKCHKEREQQRPFSQFAILEAVEDELWKGYCSHPAASASTCSAQIVGAHTIQKARNLESVAEKNHVMTFLPNKRDLIRAKGARIPHSRGVNIASVFRGFCDAHDGQLFRPIEFGTVPQNKRAAFLFSFRAIAYELFNKRHAKVIFEKAREYDQGRAFEEQVFHQQLISAHLGGISLGIKDGERWKKIYDEMFLKDDLEDFSACTIAFDSLLPIVTCGAFHPEWDLQGQKLQSLGSPLDLPEHLAFNVVAIEGKSTAFFGWIKRTNAVSEQMVRSILAVPEEQRAAMIIQLAFEQLENTYFRPSWWEGLSPVQKAAITEHVGSGMITGSERTGLSYTKRSISYPGTKFVRADFF